MPEWRMRKPVCFSLCQGENIAIIGPNGGGKSMLVDIITGKHPLIGDGVRYDFAPSTRQYVSDNIKYVCFRDTYGGDNDSTYYLQQRWNQTEIDPSTATVADKLDRACRTATGDAPTQQRLMEHICTLFGLDGILDKYVILLSSGELRKLAIATAVFSQPRVLIIDNPYIGLDATARAQLTNLLGTISAQHNIQLLLVVNRQEDVPSFITHVVEVDSMTVGPKHTRAEWAASCADSTLRLTHTANGNDDTLSQTIASIPYNVHDYSANKVVQMNNVSIKYGKRTILSQLDWTVHSGEHWALTGPNGSGKSTLLSLVCADNPQAYACDITLFDRKRGSGESIWDIKRHIGYVSPEMHRAFRANVTAERIVASGFSNAMNLYAPYKAANRDACMLWLNVFGIGHLADRSFLQMSSGEQRLVLLARAMVKDPELLILDEPLHGLDDSRRLHAKRVIQAFCQRRGKTLVMVSHYADELPACIDHTLTLTRH